MTLEYNPAYIFAQTAARYETDVAHPHMLGIQDKIQKLTQHYKDIGQLLNMVRQQKEKTHKDKEPHINFKDDPVAHALINDIRNFSKDRTLSFLPEGVFEWNGQGAVDALMQGLSEQSNFIYNTQIQPLYMEWGNEQQKNNNIFTPASTQVHKDSDSKSRIIGNQKV